MKSLKSIPIFVLVVVISLCGFCAGAAAISVGPDAGYDFTSIQGAIASVSDGEKTKITVAAGTYTEAINFLGKAVHLVSSDGPATTTIDASGLNTSVVRCVSGEGSGTVLEGFTITGGNAIGDLEDGFGGGMLNTRSSPKVINCVFFANAAILGGGMFNVESSPIVINCVFEGNRTIDGKDGVYPGGSGRHSGQGGGMFNVSSSPVITNCIFIRNSTGRGGHGAQGADYNGPGGNGARAGDGAGMYNDSSEPIVDLCQFKENKTGVGGNGGHGGWRNSWKAEYGGLAGHGGDGGNGAGMYNQGSSVTVTRSGFHANKAGSGGNGGRSISEDDCGRGGKGGSGAGMFNTLIDSTVVGGCSFRTNETGSGGNGGLRNSQQFTKHSGPGGDAGHGAGMYNEYLFMEVTDCTFSENRTGNAGNFGREEYLTAYGVAGNGAGIYNFNSSGSIANCQIRLNETGAGNGGGNGAGIYNRNSSPSVSHCTFNRNSTGNGLGQVIYTDYGDSGGFGAGMYNGDQSSPTVTQCNFIENRTGSGGKIVFTLSQEVWGNGEGKHGGCGGHGAGMYNGMGCSPILFKCTFNNNITGNGGKGQDALSRSADDFLLTGWNGGDGGNGGMGAGLCNDVGSSPVIEACTFSRNATGIGGLGGKRGWALFKNGKPGTPGKDGNGGAIANVSVSSAVSYSTFIANTAYKGGSVYNETSGIELINCLFRENRATHQGGAIYNINSHPLVTSCTLFGNGSNDVDQSYGIYNFSSHPILTNCILWNNLPGEMHNVESTPVVTYCNVMDGTGQFWFGTGCIDVNPIFTDVHGRLSAYSPCRSIGSITASGLPERDMDGNPRITGTTVDLGVYEFSNFTVFNDTQYTSYDFIQTAIDAAEEGDDIQILPGTYTETIDFLGKAIRLYSEDGPEVTIINGAGHHHVVQCVSGEGPDTILEGFTITGGNANGPTEAGKNGGGMRNVNSSPTVKNCIFSSNSANQFGGGMHNDTSSPTLDHCSFLDNMSTSHGGGIYNYNSSPTVINGTFNNNLAGLHGGGMMNNVNSSPIVINCLFSQNVAEAGGGGIANSINSNPTVANCTFTNNNAGDGGGLYNYASTPTLTNCIVWANWPDQISDDSSSPVVSYSSIQGGFAGIGNIDADPLFIDADGGNLRLDDNSPCIDAGNNVALPEDLILDLDGDERLRDGNLDGNAVVDMGAFEYYGRVLNTRTHTVYGTIQNAITGASHGDRLVATPGIYYERINFLGKNISLSSTDPNDSDVVAQTILDGQSSGGTVVTFENQESQDCLLDGLTITGGYSHEGAGIYCYGSYPTIRNCVIRRNRAATSIIKVVWGTPSFIGCTVSNNTVWGMPDEPSGVVLFFQCVDILLEDCTVHKNRTYGGSAIRFIGDEGSFWSTSAIIGCSITENLHLPKPGSSPFTYGGGIYFYGGQLLIEDCYIAGNTTQNTHLSGGGLWIEETSFLQISRSDIINNQAGLGGNGGGIGTFSGGGTIDNCEITGNSCGQLGGGLYGFQGDITKTLISDNSAANAGGGIHSFYGSMTHCTISNNASGSAGGGLAIAGWGGGGADITNCVFTNNSSGSGGGLSEFAGSMSNSLILGNWATLYGGGLNNCTAVLTNNIIRQNIATLGGDQLYGGSMPNYSNIQDWAGGGIGNITLDPGFRTPGVWVDHSDPNLVVEPDDPNAVWVEGNYRLTSGSPCIDAGNNAAVPTGVTTDLNGWSRFIDDLCTTDTGSGTTPLVDMGPYEFLPADMDGSGAVNFADFGVLAAHWQQSGADCAGADTNCDGVVDLADAAMLVAWWLDGI